MEEFAPNLRLPARRAHAGELSRHAQALWGGWIHLYDELPTSYGGLIETDGVEKPGYAGWKVG